MKILIIGSGGREYALAKKISKSPLADKIYTAPGNYGMRDFGETVDIKATDYDRLIDFAKDKKIDLTIVGPENPLSDGIVDKFEENGLKIFGVNKANARFEASKDFTKKFLNKYDIPTAKSETFTDYESAKDYLKDITYPIVLKADGLCFGKGVFIAKDYDNAINYLDQIFDDLNSKKIVIEEYLDGRELSSICLVSHNKIFPLEYARDFKKIFDGDKGENTGGVGSVTPVDDISDSNLEKIRMIHKKIEEGFIKEDIDYTGVLFIGLMITDKPYVLEFNVRFGDPEIEVILEKMESDLLSLILKTMDGSLKKEDIVFNDKSYLGVVLCSSGYPQAYEKNKEITINKSDLEVIHCATKYEDGKILTNGGRVLMVIAGDTTKQKAREKVYKNIGSIQFEGIYYRKDIK